jgi:hypothetical protein
MGGPTDRVKQGLAAAIFLVGSLLAACHAREEEKAADRKSVSACMATQHTHDDYVLVKTCAPLGPQMKLQGTWFVGFELSEFRMDYAGIPAEPSFDTRNTYEMVAPSALEGRAHATDPKGPSAYQVTFLGRQSSLPWGTGVKLMVADRMLSMHQVPVSPHINGPPPASEAR